MNAIQVAGAPLIAFGMTEFFLRRGAAAKSFKGTASDRGTTPLIFCCYALVVGLLFVPNLPGSILPETAAWIGVGVACAGLALRWWAMLVLGRFYTRTLRTATDQGVVARGPYRWIRHPGYLGSLITWVGAAAATRNVVLLILVSGVLIFAYARRIAVEEAMLVEALGDSYCNYQQKTWRLLPFLF